MGSAARYLRQRGIIQRLHGARAPNCVFLHPSTFLVKIERAPIRTIDVTGVIQHYRIRVAFQVRSEIVFVLEDRDQLGPHYVGCRLYLVQPWKVLTLIELYLWQPRKIKTRRLLVVDRVLAEGDVQRLIESRAALAASITPLGEALQ